MPDLPTSRIPRETLLGLINSAKDLDRITAPMPVAQLDELLAPDQTSSPELSAQGSAPELIVRLEPDYRDLTSRQVMILSFAVSLLLGVLVVLLA